MLHQIEVQVLLLLLVASMVGIAARRLRVPYTLALVAAGLVLGFVHIEALAGLRLTAELLMLLFLPPLLFEAAFHLSISEFRRNAAHILFYAVPGVVVAVAATAALSWAGIGLSGLEPSFGLGAAFLFAAVISATDPISVLALFKEFGVPRRLYLLVEGESLINDGIAVVVFGIVLAILGLPQLHGGDVEALSGVGPISVYALVTLAKTALGGLLVGAAVGALVSVVTRSIDDHLIEITLTTVAAWGAFLVAENVLHVSGVLATIAAGMMVGSFGTRFGMSPSTRMAVNDFWAYMGFLANSFIFLLLGLELESSAVVENLPAAAIGFAAVVLGRAVVIYGGTPLIDRASEPVPGPWRHVLVWGGLRGSLSMVLVLGLPVDYELRGFLITLVFGVVAGSLFGQGLTMGALMTRLGLVSTLGGELRQYQTARGRALASSHVVHQGKRLQEDGILDERSAARLLRWYEQRAATSTEQARILGGATVRPERLLEGAKALGILERESIQHAEHAGILIPDVAAELLAELDARIDRLDEAAHKNEVELVAALDELFPEA